MTAWDTELGAVLRLHPGVIAADQQVKNRCKQVIACWEELGAVLHSRVDELSRPATSLNDSNEVHIPDESSSRLEASDTQNAHIAMTDGIDQSTAVAHVQQSWSRAYVRDLVSAAALLPAVASVVTLGAYFLPYSVDQTWLRSQSVLVGLVISLVVWLVVSPAYAYLASVRADERNFTELEARVDIIGTQLDVLRLLPSSFTDAQHMQYREASRLFLEVRERLEALSLHRPTGSSARLTPASAYIELWNLVHRTEEALIGVTPLDLLFETVLHNELRLDDSNLRNRDVLKQRLLAAGKYLRDVSSHTRPNGHVSNAPADVL
jgi:hypothetical protein